MTPPYSGRPKCNDAGAISHHLNKNLGSAIAHIYYFYFEWFRIQWVGPIVKFHPLTQDSLVTIYPMGITGPTNVKRVHSLENVQKEHPEDPSRGGKCR